MKSAEDSGGASSPALQVLFGRRCSAALQGQEINSCPTEDDLNFFGGGRLLRRGYGAQGGPRPTDYHRRGSFAKATEPEGAACFAILLRPFGFPRLRSGQVAQGKRGFAGQAASQPMKSAEDSGGASSPALQVLFGRRCSAALQGQEINSCPTEDDLNFFGGGPVRLRSLQAAPPPYIQTSCGRLRFDRLTLRFHSG